MFCSQKSTPLLAWVYVLHSLSTPLPDSESWLHIANWPQSAALLLVCLLIALGDELFEERETFAEFPP